MGLLYSKTIVVRLLDGGTSGIQLIEPLSNNETRNSDIGCTKKGAH